MKKLFAVIFAFLILSTSAYADNRNVIVHRTRTGECYHSDGCSYLKSDIEVTLEEAVERGLRPCSRCNPPRPNFSTSRDVVKSSSNEQISQNIDKGSDDGWPLVPTVAIFSSVAGMFFYEERKNRK